MATQLCKRCDRLKTLSARLRGSRLGKRERALLLLTKARGTNKPVPMPPQGVSNAEKVALRRAVHKLADLSLIGVLAGEDRRYRKDRRGRRRLAHRLRFVVPTRLGEAVADACAEELAANRPIRWNQRLPTVRRAIYDECGCVPPDERDRFT